MSEITPSQTVGPFFAYGLTPKGRAHWDPDGLSLALVGNLREAGIGSP